MGIREFSILHISDLHKGKECKYDNLLDSLLKDRSSYSKEGVPPVKFVVLSGDLIKGSKNDNLKEANKEIESQYAEVELFLNNLVNEFLDGDKERIIMVPGNHDVNRCISQLAMVPIISKDEIKKAKESYLSMERSSIGIYRWSWSNLQFYKIADDELYNKRFDKFAEFYDRFYSDVNRRFPIKREEEAYFLPFENYDIAFACFNSCYRLDHLNPMALIHGDAVHSVNANLVSAHERGMLIIGVWHHHIYGYPYSNNFLDRNIVKFLGASHIRLGLFGHQHMSEAVEELQDFLSFNDNKMLLVSSGTLFGDSETMRNGIKRQYNVISVKILNGEAVLTFRCREDHMNDAPYPIWKPKFLLNGREAFDYSIELEKSYNNNILSINEKIQASADFKNGFIQMKNIKNEQIALKFSDEYLSHLSTTENVDFIIDNIKDPETEIEYAYLLDAYISKDNKESIKYLLNDSRYNDSTNILVKDVIERANKKIKIKSWKRLE